MQLNLWGSYLDFGFRALVEVKPLLYSAENMEVPTSVTTQDLPTKQAYWGFQHESWHNGCLQTCSVSGRICAAVISITQEITSKICCQTTDPVNNEPDCKAKTEKLAKIAEFCIYLLDNVLLENDLLWDDILVSYLFNWILRCVHHFDFYLIVLYTPFFTYWVPAFQQSCYI